MYKYKSILLPLPIPEVKKNFISNLFNNTGPNNKGPNNNGPKIILIGLFIFVVHHNYKDIKKYIKIF
jgi:hypothetical protein